MIGLHAQEEETQARWHRHATDLGDGEELAVDGLLFRGKPQYYDGSWHREKDEEEAQWAKARRSLLILTKDLNDEEAWDIRHETGRYNTVVFNYDRAMPFYKNLRMWSYGLLNATADGYPDYSIASNQQIVGPHYESAPIARVNCKKQVGGGSISNATLKSYLETYAQFLVEQIGIYKASIILCCGNSGEQNLILDFVKSQCLPDLEYVPDSDGWVYYSPSTKTIVIDSFHPSARIGYEETYNQMMTGYVKALRHLNLENP